MLDIVYANESDFDYVYKLSSKKLLASFTCVITDSADVPPYEFLLFTEASRVI